MANQYDQSKNMYHRLFNPIRQPKREEMRESQNASPAKCSFELNKFRD
jgi:hypothetical protein